MSNHVGGLFVPKDFALDDAMQHIAEAEFLFMSFLNERFDLGAIRESKFAAGGEGEQLFNHAMRDRVGPVEK